MLKNFLIELGNIFKCAGVLYKETFKKQGLIIWLLILVQVLLFVPLSYFYRTIGFGEFSILQKTSFVLGIIAYLTAFFFMFKEVFNIASVGFKKEKITYKRTLLGLLIIGILNCLPVLLFAIMFALAKMFLNLAIVFKIILNIFSYLFYFALSMSLASIIKWDKDNVIVAIFKSIKVFFQKSGLTILTFGFYFVFAKILTFILCTIVYAIALYFNVLDEVLANVIQMAINLYSLYLVAGLYIGSQVKILGNEDEQLQSDIEEK